MSSSDSPYSQDTIILCLQKLHEEGARFYGSIPVSRFFDRSLSAWSPAENLEHLIRSVKPVVQAMRLPKVLLQLLFGTAPAPSRSFNAIKEEYSRELTKGAQATGRYLPTQTGLPTNLEVAKTQLLSQWARVGQELIYSVKTWNESELDKYVLPHPILGRLTIREMLFFTLYHNTRHIFSGMD